MLLGETDLTLESVLQKRKLNEHNYLNILIDISWWLMELHGENKGWKVFYAAIEPSKIGLVEINGNYHAYIMNYKMAQGKFFTENNPCDVSLRYCSINTGYYK